MKNLFLSIIAITAMACGNSEPAQEIAETESVNVEVKGQEVSYQADTTTLKGYLTTPNSEGKVPGILVVHEWWGHNSYARHRADMLAELGYTALAVDMYGDGKTACHPEEAGAFAGMVMGNFEVAKARFNAALELLKQQPNVDTNRIAAIGYCFGGSVVVSMADAGADIDGVVAFHAGLGLPQMPTNGMKAKVLVLNGAADPFIPAEQITALQSAMDSVGAAYEYKTYPEAVHAFTNPEADSLGAKFNLPLAYNEAADKASWEDMQAFFKKLFE